MELNNKAILSLKHNTISVAMYVVLSNHVNMQLLVIHVEQQMVCKTAEAYM